MAKLFVTALRRIIVSAGGGVIFGLQSGVRQVHQITKNAIYKATGVVHSVHKAVVNDLKNGTSQTVSVQGSARQDMAAGVVHAFNISPEQIEKQTGQAMTRIALGNTTGYDNGGTVGYAVGADNDWQDLANFDGRIEPEASIQGGKGVGSLTPKAGGIRGTFAAPNTGKDNQTIISVELRVYLRQTGTLLANGTLVWRLAGAISKALGSESGDVDQEYVYDLTADVAGDWAKLRGLNIEVEGSSALLGRACYARRAYITVISERTITL